MPQYEVKFIVNEPHDLNDAEVAELAHTVHDRLANVKPGIKPEGRKVCITRLYSNAEEREIVKKHAAFDKLAGRDWNTAGGCTCDLCKIYRGMGAVIE